MTGAQIAAAARRQTTVIPRGSSGEPRRRRFQALMFGAVGLAFLGLGAIIYDFASDGRPSSAWEFLTSFPSRVVPERRASSRRSSGRST